MLEQENLMSNANILIVDDVTANLVVLSEMIKQAGCTARPVNSVKQAMQAIDILKPQLILLDISMPEIDGFEWCAMLKKNPQTREIPIIFISAMNSMEDKIRGFKLGAVDFISKPFELEEVTLRVNTHLKNYRMQCEMENYNQNLQKLVNEQIAKIAMEQESLIYAMAKIAEAKDSIRENHIENIAKNAWLLALSLQYSGIESKAITNEYIDMIKLASPLHDIGKTAIPDSIMQKEGELTEEENAVMQTHTSLGAETLIKAYEHNECNGFLKMAIDIAYCHHENWDGSGYPKGLRENEIPLAARIVAIVDSYDTWLGEELKDKSLNDQNMSEDDRVTLCHNQVIKRMLLESGKRFDPVIMQVFVKIQRQLRR